MARTDTKNETIIPTKSTKTSGPVNDASVRNLKIFKRLAPTIVGMARKKENSAPADRPTPNKKAPKIVEPERDVPGIRLRH